MNHSWRIPPGLSPAVVSRFWSKIDQSAGPDACWLWKAGKDKDGYGKFQFGPRGGQTHVRAHRLALNLSSATDGSVAQHSCDTPGCCNPRHLSWGTDLTNRLDCVSKLRHARSSTHGTVQHPERIRRGAQHAQVKLSDAQVDDIRRRYIPGKNSAALATEFGVHAATIRGIAKGRYRRDSLPRNARNLHDDGIVAPPGVSR